MIRDTGTDQQPLFAAGDFQTPFGGALDPDNRWVRWARQIPWGELSAAYHESLKAGGRPAKPARLMIGALIIKHRLGLTDVETIEQLRENPYLQYFCGFECFQHEAAFAPTLFVALRRRLSPECFAAFEQAVIDGLAGVAQCRAESAQASDAADDDSDQAPPADDTDGAASEEASAPAPQGTLVIDASVAEKKIRYPNDVGLLNEARESAEAILDGVWQRLIKLQLTQDRRKPRTYRQRARRDYLRYSKQRKRGGRNARMARRQQLQYLRRDLACIDALLDDWQTALPKAGFPLPRRDQYRLWVIREVYRQQAHMHRQRTRRIDARIVSLHQPHVRPIVRGRLGHPVEFGSKFSVALVNGIACVDHLRWNAFSEAADLISQCQTYRDRHGYYPAKVLADGAYGTRANRRWLKAHAIQFGGKPLGRPPKRSPAEQRAVNQQRTADARARIPIEGTTAKARTPMA